MSHNPLIGSRISLISSKNIRYEGILCDVSETEASITLQNVRSFGTEGRERLEPGAIFHPPQDTIHPFLLFTGRDIKDLHVHESSAAASGGGAAAPTTTAASSRKETTDSSPKTISTTTVAPPPATPMTTSTASVQPQAPSSSTSAVHTISNTPVEAVAVSSRTSPVPATTKVPMTKTTTTVQPPPSSAMAATTTTTATDQTALPGATAAGVILGKELSKTDPKSSKNNNQGGTTKGNASKNRKSTTRDNVSSSKLTSSNTTPTATHPLTANATAVTATTTTTATTTQTTKPKVTNDSSSTKHLPSSQNHRNMIGSGASLLSRKSRGPVAGVQGPNKDISTDFDFESHLEEFKTSLESSIPSSSNVQPKEQQQQQQQIQQQQTFPLTTIPKDNKVYNKDDFFDTISCDVLDRQRGIDTRLHGSQERSLNTETFGAVSLSHSLGGGRGGRGRGRGRGGGGGRHSSSSSFTGRGKKGGDGDEGHGSGGRYGHGGSWKENDKNPKNTLGNHNNTKVGGGSSLNTHTRRNRESVAKDK